MELNIYNSIQPEQTTDGWLGSDDFDNQNSASDSEVTVSGLLHDLLRFQSSLSSVWSGCLDMVTVPASESSFRDLEFSFTCA